MLPVGNCACYINYRLKWFKQVYGSNNSYFVINEDNQAPSYLTEFISGYSPLWQHPLDPNVSEENVFG